MGTSWAYFLTNYNGDLFIYNVSDFPTYLIQKKYIKFVDVGSYPFFRLGKIGVAIVTRSNSNLKLKRINKELIKLANSKKLKILKI